MYKYIHRHVWLLGLIWLLLHGASAQTCGDGTTDSPESCDGGSFCDNGTTDCTGNPSACNGIGTSTCAPRNIGTCSEQCSVADSCQFSLARPTTTHYTIPSSIGGLSTPTGQQYIDVTGVSPDGSVVVNVIGSANSAPGGLLISIFNAEDDSPTHRLSLSTANFQSFIQTSPNTQTVRSTSNVHVTKNYIVIIVFGIAIQNAQSYTFILDHTAIRQLGPTQSDIAVPFNAPYLRILRLGFTAISSHISFLHDVTQRRNADDDVIYALITSQLYSSNNLLINPSSPGNNIFAATIDLAGMFTAVTTINVDISMSTIAGYPASTLNSPPPSPLSYFSAIYINPLGGSTSNAIFAPTGILISNRVGSILSITAGTDTILVTTGHMLFSTSPNVFRPYYIALKIDGTGKAVQSTASLTTATISSTSASTMIANSWPTTGGAYFSGYPYTTFLPDLANDHAGDDIFMLILRPNYYTSLASGHSIPAACKINSATLALTCVEDDSGVVDRIFGIIPGQLPNTIRLLQITFSPSTALSIQTHNVTFANGNLPAANAVIGSLVHSVQAYNSGLSSAALFNSIQQQQQTSQHSHLVTSPGRLSFVTTSVPTTSVSNLSPNPRLFIENDCVGIKCGNGAQDSGEVCDDGNTVNGDGCTSQCVPENGFACQGFPSVCVLCGDGKLEGDEECDDGDTDDNDGCSSTCEIESGYVCEQPNGNTTIPSVCALLVCGNGVKQPGETCDDGNTEGGDGCSALCYQEVGYECTGTTPSVCTAILCGNSNTDGAETCDDGNNVDEDGCSARCTTEIAGECSLGSAFVKSSSRYNLPQSVGGSSLSNALNTAVSKYSPDGSGFVVMSSIAGNQGVSLAEYNADQVGVPKCQRRINHNTGGSAFGNIQSSSSAYILLQRLAVTENYIIIYSPRAFTSTQSGLVTIVRRYTTFNATAGELLSSKCGTTIPRSDVSFLQFGGVSKRYRPFDIAIRPGATGDKMYILFGKINAAPTNSDMMHLATIDAAAAFADDVSLGNTLIPTFTDLASQTSVPSWISYFDITPQAPAAPTAIPNTLIASGSSAIAAQILTVTASPRSLLITTGRLAVVGIDSTAVYHIAYALNTTTYDPITSSGSTNSVVVSQTSRSPDSTAVPSWPVISQLPLIPADATFSGTPSVVYAPVSGIRGANLDTFVHVMRPNYHSQIPQSQSLTTQTQTHFTFCDIDVSSPGSTSITCTALSGSHSARIMDITGADSSGNLIALTYDYSSAPVMRLQNITGWVNDPVPSAATINAASSSLVTVMDNTNPGVGIPGPFLSTCAAFSTSSGFANVRGNTYSLSFLSSRTVVGLTRPSDIVIMCSGITGSSSGSTPLYQATLPNLYFREQCFTVCGDGSITANELCDDGNSRNGDGCSDTCEIEPNFICPTPDQPCIRERDECGDGIVSGTEECDDGNTDPNDGCSPTCTTQAVTGKF